MNKPLLIALFGGCFVFIMCIVCCFASIFVGTGIAFQVGIDTLKSSVVNEVCTTNADFDEIYLQSTTKNLRSEMTEEEFVIEMEQLQGDVCTALKDVQPIQIITQGWNISTSNINGDKEFSASMTIDGKDIEIVMKNEDSDELKFDFIKVD